MKEYLFIDGYNLIHGWEKLQKEMNEISLESARGKLLEILANYQGYRKIKTVVVFDSHYVKNSMEKAENYHGVEVVFTKEYESADGYIERKISAMEKEDTIRVVTDDFLEQLQILGYGAIRVTIGEFVEEIEKISRDHLQDKYNKKIGRNRLETLLNDDVRETLENWRINGKKM